MNTKKIAYRNSLAGKLFLQRVDHSDWADYSSEQVINASLLDADMFVDQAVAFQEDKEAETKYEADDSCGSCTACDDEGYMQSRPGETFGAFLERVYADRDASIAKQVAQAKQQIIKDAKTPVGEQELKFTTLKELFEQLEQQLYARGVLKG